MGASKFRSASVGIGLLLVGWVPGCQKFERPCNADSDCPAGAHCDTSDGSCLLGDAGFVVAEACNHEAKGVPCGLCAECDGAGGCSGVPADDAACGTIACSGLSSECRTYANVTTSRCAALGTCKYVEPADCPTYVNTSSGTPCGPPICVGNTWQEPGCDGAGGCVPNGTSVACDPYVCQPLSGGCPSTCQNNGECTSALCDLNSNTCIPASRILNVDCSSNPDALQTAIGGCPHSGTCYLLVQGTCHRAMVSDLNVYMSGAPGTSATIDPGRQPATLGPAVLVSDSSAVTSLTLANITVQNPLMIGSVPGDGVECMSARHPVSCFVYNASVRGCLGSGISADHVTVVVKASVIESNDGNGLLLQDSTFALVNDVIASNGTGSPGGWGVKIVTTAPPQGMSVAYCTIVNNGTGLSGGAMLCPGPAVAVERCILWSANPTARSTVGCSLDATSEDPALPGADACGGLLASDFANAAFGDYDLARGSPCEASVSCDTVAARYDVHGNLRPCSLTGRCSVGADESCQ